MASKINVQFGPFVFSSGYVPHTIQGPLKDMYVVEHQVPASEGGVVEYVGSKQPTYQIKGFLAPSNDTINGPAGAVISGAAGSTNTPAIGAVTADTAKDYLIGIRGSGPQLLRIESAWSLMSGYKILYENDFFNVKKVVVAYEAGRAYPYYPYSMDLVRGSWRFFGRSGGLQAYSGSVGQYFSGYAVGELISGLQGGFLTGVGFAVNNVASGNAKVGIYDVNGSGLAQTVSQPITSGWNYFPVNPTFTTTSGSSYIVLIASDVANTSGFTIQSVDLGGAANLAFLYSGFGTYTANNMPNISGLGAVFANVSGIQLNIVMVTT